MDIFKLALFALVLAAISCVVSAICPDILDKELPVKFEIVFYGGAMIILLWLFWRSLK